MAHRSAQQRYIRWAACGVACGALALILCGSRKNDGWIPVNKVRAVLAVATTAAAALGITHAAAHVAR